MNTREALISAATDLLDAGGVAGVTLREVGRRACVSHNAPYKHFSSKEDLLAAIATDELRWLSTLLRTKSETTPSLIRALARGAIDLARAGHLATGQKGNADPADLLDDLFAYLSASTTVPDGE